MKKTMAVVTIVFLGIAGMTGCASSERLLIQKNWEMKLPDGGTEDYHADTGASFHGDGEKYTVFQYRSTEDVSAFLDWKKDEDTATRYEDSYAEFAEKCLDTIDVPSEERPDYKECVYWYRERETDFSELLLAYDDGKEQLYVIESVR